MMGAALSWCHEGARRSAVVVARDGRCVVRCVTQLRCAMYLMSDADARHAEEVM